MGGGGPVDEASGSLIGRGYDLAYIIAFADRTAVSGGALLLSGEAGVGKTALLDAAARHAETAGTRVLRAAGAEFEGSVSFAGLNQLLRPLLGQTRGLSAAYRKALAVALGCVKAHLRISCCCPTGHHVARGDPVPAAAGGA
jgi:AAA ATPase domain